MDDPPAALHLALGREAAAPFAHPFEKMAGRRNDRWAWDTILSAARSKRGEFNSDSHRARMVRAGGNHKDWTGAIGGCRWKSGIRYG